jgi:hypothetical protein
MPSTVNVTPNRMVSKHYFDPGVFGCADGPSLRTFFFARGIRFVRALDTGPIKGRSGLEQRQSVLRGAKDLMVWRQKLILSSKLLLLSSQTLWLLRSRT